MLFLYTNMPYHKEKEENGEYAIVIDSWDKGIGDSPYTGMNTLNQVNLAVPGEVSVGFPLSTNTTSGVTLGKPISRAVDISVGASQAYYILDDAGHVFKSTTVNGTFTYLSSNATLTSASADDSIVFWNGYLFKFRSTFIDYWTGSTWVNGWNPATGGSGASTITSAPHFALSTQDNAIYFCNGKTIGSIVYVSGTFDPTVAQGTTYTFNVSALTLSPEDFAQSLGELSTLLLIGGSLNKIYPWDRVSTTFKYPIFVADSFVKRIVTANTNCFLFMGNTTGRGRIFITNGTNANLYYKIPDFIVNRTEPYFRWGDAIYYRDSLMFGFEPTDNSGSDLNVGGVWAIDLETKAFRQVSNVTGYANVLIGSQSSSNKAGMAYITGIYDSSNNYSIQNSSTAAGTGTATIVTDTIPIGTILNKRTFKQVEFKLGTALASGESIALTAIYDLNNSVSIGTWNTVGDFSGYFPVTFEKNQWLSIQAFITGNSSSGVRLREIRIR